MADPGDSLTVCVEPGLVPAKAKCVELGENEWVRGAVGTRGPSWLGRCLILDRVYTV